MKSLSHVRLLATPWTAAYQAPLSMDFPGKSTGVGCHCLLRARCDLTNNTFFFAGIMVTLKILERKCSLSLFKYESEIIKFDLASYNININIVLFTSLSQVPWTAPQFSRSVVSDSLRPHELQHARPTCPSTTPGVHQTHVHRVHPAISSSVVPFSSCPQSLPASESFPMSQLFA